MSYRFYRILHGHTVLDSFFGMQLWGHLDSFIGTEVVQSTRTRMSTVLVLVPV